MQQTPKRVLLPIDGHVVAADVHLRDDLRPPVVFFHGLMTSLAVASELFVDAESESWIALSLPGHHPGAFPAGLSRKAVDAELFAALADAALTRLVGDRPVIAAGWSTGGFAAINLAIHRPRRVAAVASLAGFAGGRVTGSIGWLQWLARGGVGSACLRAGVWAASRLPPLHDAIIRSCAADRAAAAAAPKAVIDRMRADFRHHDPAALAVMLAAVHELDIGDRLGDVRVPAWIACGGLDPVIPFTETVRLANGIAGAQLRVYDSGGHLFFSEWPGVREDFAAWRRGLAAVGSESAEGCGPPS
ncbi:MAG: alpha/beta hydrolase [Planctomycetia bacterium]|nr:alpha/beta hydrolase [Planctomycetia bacterium]